MFNAVVSREAMSLAHPFGPVFWGICLNLIGLGVTFAQAWSYARTASQDRLPVKLSALAMLAFDIASTGLILSVFWTDLILDFGDAELFQGTSPTIAAECTISAFIALLAQIYFMVQISYIKPAGKLGTIILWTIGCLAVIAFGAGLGCASFMALAPTTPHYNLKFQLTFGLAKGANSLCDIIATVMMTIYLQGSKTGVSSTENLLDSLTIIFMNRGAAVMLVQVFTFVMFWAFFNPQYWLAPHLVLTKVYVNTFFAILNSRSYLREKHLNSSFPSSIGGGLGGSHGSSGVALDGEKFVARPGNLDATITKDVLVRTDSNSEVHMV
ncbi:hypothetical protein C8F04DRAFT_69293 [Mycena alexandri]|uniref:DUF6534 domain-containing protein n=1 Tax=Mycena alexandri TaxID=1745969 RepID=A0AAD6SLY5_9AGAR|nr:hypothetical protein C8F04DRAFT_69293 [Mycena alexandri]